MTLEECSPDSRIEFGSFFVHPEAKMARGVYIGCHCILGKTVIGERTHIASGVQILSGKRQHPRDSAGKLLGAEHGTFESVSIGEDCWIGAGVIILAQVGARCTVGSGAVVVQPIAADSVAVGNPARIVSSTSSPAA
jgi:acetyltransferase-like isoleucine patch superfamily enzyme